MNRRLIICACVLIFLIGCKSTETVQEQGTAPREEDLAGGPKYRVAVVSVDNQTIYGRQRLGNSATDIFISELASTGKVILIERANIENVMNEQEMTMSGLVDPENQIQLGNMLGADYLIFGSISQFGVHTDMAKQYWHKPRHRSPNVQ